MKLKTEQMMALLNDAYNPGNWIQTPRIYFQIMPIEEATLFNLLVSHSRVVRPDVEGNGWFYCTMYKIMKELNINQKMQSRLMSKLKDRGFIFTKMQTGRVPPVRLIKINWRAVAVELWKYRDSIPLPEQQKKDKSRLQLILEMEEDERRNGTAS